MDFLHVQLFASKITMITIVDMKNLCNHVCLLLLLQKQNNNIEFISRGRRKFYRDEIKSEFYLYFHWIKIRNFYSHFSEPLLSVIYRLWSFKWERSIIYGFVFRRQTTTKLSKKYKWSLFNVASFHETRSL